MERIDPLPSAPLAGAGYMSLAMLMGAGIDIGAKALAADFATAQIVLMRTTLALPLVLLICQYQGGLKALATRYWGWQIYRGFLTAGANFGFFYGLAYIPLVNAVLLAYIAPVMIVLLARPMLGERVGLKRWIGVLIAFAGVLVVLRPDRFEIHPAALAILGSSVCWALLSLSNRRLAGEVATGVLTFYTLPVSALIAGILTADVWVQPAATDWLLFAMIGVCGGSAHFFVAMAYRHAPAGVVAPFEYTTLLWTALAGYVFWDEQPGVWIWLGGLAVIAGGYLAVRASPAPDQAQAG